MLANDMPVCKDCGAQFDSNEDGSVCPQCGSKSKVVNANVNIKISIYMRWKMIGIRAGKQIFELIFGHERYIKVNRMVKKSRLIDRENNWYEESVIDPRTGEVIHETKEKLTDHYGHGSAKSKRNS